jgi:hypothetical protein
VSVQKIVLNAKRPQKPQARARHLKSTAIFALLLFASTAFGLSACSRKSLPSDEFKILDSSPQNQTRAQALAAAKATCAKQTEHHGISSVFGIFSHLRPGAAQRDYIDCMKAQGFDAEATGTNDPNATASSDGSEPIAGDPADPAHPQKGHIMSSPRAITTGINPTISGY